MDSQTTTPHASSFDALPLRPDVRRAIDDIGYTQPTPVQLATYQPAVDGDDLIVQSQTGTGKTASFAIPLVDRLVRDDAQAQALILAPTRELALQSAREVERIGQHTKVRTVAVYGGAPMQRQIDELRDGAQIVSGTPGRVLDHLKRGTLDASNLSVLVLDEMDEMLSMGFARELNAIIDLLPTDRQTLCFSATVDEAFQRLAKRYMREPRIITLSSDAIGASRISHYMYVVSGKDRTRDLIRILEVEDPETAIIFCNMRSETEKVAGDLQAAGFNADWLNGDLPQRDRESIMGRTRRGELRYLVATDVAARGIDVSHLTHVINYTFPDSPAGYVHRTGRTGRAGRTGTAISLVSPQELGSLYYLRLEYKIVPIERTLPSSGELKTRQEADRLGLLDAAFQRRPSHIDLSVAQRLLSHPDAERIVAGLVHAFLGGPEEDVTEQAAAARRSRAPAPVPESQERTERSERPQRERPPRAARTPRPETSSPKPRRAAAEESQDEGGNDDLPESEQTTLFVKLGRRDGLRTGELARLLQDQCGLAREEIGRIRVRDRHSFIGIPTDRADDVLKNLQGAELHEKKLEAEVARVTRV